MIVDGYDENPFPYEVGEIVAYIDNDGKETGELCRLNYANCLFVGFTYLKGEAAGGSFTMRIERAHDEAFRKATRGEMKVAERIMRSRERVSDALLKTLRALGRRGGGVELVGTFLRGNERLNQSVEEEIVDDLYDVRLVAVPSDLVNDVEMGRVLGELEELLRKRSGGR